MKKLFLVAIVALAMGLGMTSCKQNAAPAGEAAEAEQTEAPADPIKALTDLTAKAKAEGANWSVDEWKANFKQAVICAKPMFNELSAVTKEMKAAEGDEAKAMELLGKMGEIADKYKDVDSLFTAYGEVAKSFPNGKIVNDDKEFGEKLLKELGIEMDFK